MGKVPIFFRVDPELKAEVEDAAADEGRTVPNLIIRATKQYLERRSDADVKPPPAAKPAVRKSAAKEKK